MPALCLTSWRPLPCEWSGLRRVPLACVRASSRGRGQPPCSDISAQGCFSGSGRLPGVGEGTGSASHRQGGLPALGCIGATSVPGGCRCEQVGLQQATPLIQAGSGVKPKDPAEERGAASIICPTPGGGSCAA